MKTSAELLARLGELGIAVSTAEHQAVFTVEEARRHRGDLPGTFTKSLSLRDTEGALSTAPYALTTRSTFTRWTTRRRRPSPPRIRSGSSTPRATCRTRPISRVDAPRAGP